MIKDSGERTEFSTGAVRDMQGGKGRFDLLPWNAIHEVAKHCEEGALKYGERNVDKGIPQHSFIDSGIRHLSKYIRNFTDEDHLRAAAWNILWALEQETTHKELNDLPFRKEETEKDDIFDRCCSECEYGEVRGISDHVVCTNYKSPLYFGLVDLPDYTSCKHFKLHKEE